VTTIAEERAMCGGSADDDEVDDQDDDADDNADDEDADAKSDRVGPCEP
jgi:hypothetical protein